jgi:hypothetical protein
MGNADLREDALENADVEQRPNDADGVVVRHARDGFHFLYCW